MRKESEVNKCCGRLFLAEVARDEPGVLLLECCVCGRAWRRKRDGSLVPRNDGQPRGSAKTPSSQGK